METPDTTAVQIKAIILWLVSFLALVGLQVSDATANAWILVATGFLTTVLPVALVVADAAIRRARAKNLTAITQSKVALAPLSAPSTDSYGN